MRHRALALIAIIAAAPAVAAPDDKSTPTVVVTGTRLSETERALKNCVARKCPVEEDVAATLAHAENLFVAGRYGEARNTLLAGRGRTRRFAKTYPVAVSKVTRAIATVSAHLGEPESYQLSTIDTLDVLKAGLPRDDARVLEARVEVATMFGRLGRIEAAEQMFRAVAARAKELDLIRIQGFAELRLAVLYEQLAEGDPGIYAKSARDIIAAIESNPDPRYAVFVKAARILEARKLARKGDVKAFDAVLADVRAIGATDQPVLVYAPPIEQLRDAVRGAYQPINNSGPEQSDRFTAGSGVPTLTEYSRLPLQLFDDQWVDVGFYVTPDGRTADIGILRTSPKLESESWVKPIFKSIALRRYLPLKRDASDPGILRIERYTLTSLMEARIGTRIRQRSPEPRLEVLDLSVDPAPAKPRDGSI